MLTDFHNFFHFVQHKVLFHIVLIFIMHFLVVTSFKEKACNNTNQKRYNTLDCETDDYKLLLLLFFSLLVCPKYTRP